MNYREELQRATDLLAKEGYIFLGQNMKHGGTSMFHMVKHLHEVQRIELPIFEDIQLCIIVGLTLEGLKICSVYPRMDFLVLALNQLINHADKVKTMSDGRFRLNGLIIRTAIGSTKPLMPGPQHSQDHTEALKLMCKDIKVIKLESPEQIYPAYEEAMESDIPTIIVELPDKYNEDLKEELINSRKEIIR